MTDARTILIPPLKRGAARVTIRGISDLIMHAWDSKTIKEMEEKHAKAAKKAKDKRDPEAEFEAAKYKDEKGRDCLLSAAIKHAIVGAARNLDEVKMSELKQQIFVRGERIPIVYEEIEMRRDPVRIGMGKPDIRYRPGYKNWSATFDIEWDAGKLEVNQVLHLLQVAGFSVGIHEWRPSKGGDFGRFELLEATTVGEPEAAKAA